MTVNRIDQVCFIDSCSVSISLFILNLPIAALFYSIETETGQRISLTSNHFLAVQRSEEYIPASQIKPNDRVFLFQQGRFQTVAVRNVTEQYKVGYLTPMTSHGEIFSFPLNM